MKLKHLPALFTMDCVQNNNAVANCQLKNAVQAATPPSVAAATQPVMVFQPASNTAMNNAKPFPAVTNAKPLTVVDNAKPFKLVVNAKPFKPVNNVKPVTDYDDWLDSLSKPKNNANAKPLTDYGDWLVDSVFNGNVAFPSQPSPPMTWDINGNVNRETWGVNGNANRKTWDIRREIWDQPGVSKIEYCDSACWKQPATKPKNYLKKNKQTDINLDLGWWAYIVSLMPMSYSFNDNITGLKTGVVRWIKVGKDVMGIWN